MESLRRPPSFRSLSLLAFSLFLPTSCKRTVISSSHPPPTQQAFIGGRQHGPNEKPARSPALSRALASTKDEQEVRGTSRRACEKFYFRPLGFRRCRAPVRSAGKLQPPTTPPLQEDQGVGQSKVLCGRTTTSKSNRRSNSLHTKFSPACCRPWRVRFGRCSCGSPGKAVRRPESFGGVGWRQQKMLGFWELFFFWHCVIYLNEEAMGDEIYGPQSFLEHNSRKWE